MAARETLWERTARIARTGAADIVRTLPCPNCSGSLAIEYKLASTQDDGSIAGRLTIQCFECQMLMVAYGIKKRPGWIDVLGGTFDTSPQSH